MPNLEIEKLKPRREICGLPGRPHEVANITVLIQRRGAWAEQRLASPYSQSNTTERGFEHRSGEEVGGKSELPGGQRLAMSNNGEWTSPLRASDAALAWKHLIL